MNSGTIIQGAGSRMTADHAEARCAVAVLLYLRKACMKETLSQAEVTTCRCHKKNREARFLSFLIGANENRLVTIKK
jgi:hypothetical protein